MGRSTVLVDEHFLDMFVDQMRECGVLTYKRGRWHSNYHIYVIGVEGDVVPDAPMVECTFTEERPGRVASVSFEIREKI